ncbi:hypothetical protein ISS21_02285 [Patescibacteria group bacterium]|nr:hypothetical protein [Patescibacteria group bacterium]
MTLEQTLQQIQKSKFWRDKKILGLIGEAGVLNLLLWLYILFTFWGTIEPIVLHYNILFGIDSVGPWRKLLVLPLLGSGILIVNSVLIFYFYLLRRESLINLLAVGLLVSQIVLLTSVLLIINL